MTTKNFAMLARVQLSTNYFGECVGIKWKPSRPIRDDELEALIAYGFHLLDKEGANICEITITKIIIVQE